MSGIKEIFTIDLTEIKMISGCYYQQYYVNKFDDSNEMYAFPEKYDIANLPTLV